MPHVRVKGVTNPMQFPDDMDINDIRGFLQRKFTNQAIEGNQPADLDPLQGQARATEQTLAEKAGQGISNALVDSGIISDRFGAQQIGENVTSIGEFLPGIGDATAGDEFGRALKQGDGVGMALGALGAIPLVGDAAKKAVKSPLFKVHNITEGGLAKADEFGGIPVPSIAIAGGDTGFDSFGDISLVGDKASFAKDPTFASDVFSPRTPRAKDKIDSKFAREEAKRLAEVVDPRIDSGFDSQFDSSRLSEDLDRVGESVGNKQAFLKSQGKGVDPGDFQSIPEDYTPPEWYSDFSQGKSKFPTFKSFDNPEFEGKATRMIEGWDKNKEVSDWWDGDKLSREGQKLALTSIRGETNKVLSAAKGPQFDRTKVRAEIDRRVSENSESFTSYISNQKRKLSQGKIFEKWNPNTATTKTFDANLANAVKLMKGNIRGGEGFNYGVGSIRAQATPQLKSINQIQNRRGQIVGEDSMTLVKEGFDSRLDNLYDSLKGNWAFQSDPSYSDFADGIANAAKGDFADFKGLSASQKGELTGFFDELANAPTNYFEIKPQRAVDINEFFGAAVPEGTSKDVIDNLKSRGLAVETYKPDERKVAIKALNKKSGGNIFFSGGGAALLYGTTRENGEEPKND